MKISEMIMDAARAVSRQAKKLVRKESWKDSSKALDETQELFALEEEGFDNSTQVPKHNTKRVSPAKEEVKKEKEINGNLPEEQAKQNVESKKAKLIQEYLEIMKPVNEMIGFQSKRGVEKFGESLEKAFNDSNEALKTLESGSDIQKEARKKMNFLGNLHNYHQHFSKDIKVNNFANAQHYLQNTKDYINKAYYELLINKDISSDKGFLSSLVNKVKGLFPKNAQEEVVSEEQLEENVKLASKEEKQKPIQLNTELDIISFIKKDLKIKDRKIDNDLIEDTQTLPWLAETHLEKIKPLLTNFKIVVAENDGHHPNLITDDKKLKVQLTEALKSEKNKQNTAFFVNHNNSHWLGLYVDAIEEKIYFIDPFNKSLEDYPKIKADIDEAMKDQEIQDQGFAIEPLFSHKVQLDGKNCGRFVGMALVGLDSGMKAEEFRIPNVEDIQSLDTNYLKSFAQNYMENSAVLVSDINNNFFQSENNDETKRETNKQYWRNYKNNTLNDILPNISFYVAVEATLLIERHFSGEDGVKLRKDELEKFLENIDKFYAAKAKGQVNKESLDEIKNCIKTHGPKITDDEYKEINKDIQQVFAKDTTIKKMSENDRKELLALNDILLQHKSKAAYDKIKPIVDKYLPKQKRPNNLGR